MRKFIAIVVAAGLVACGSPPLRHTYQSADALARAVLDALQAGDEPALRMLALDETEFRAHVWPGLPAARTERNLPFSYVWGDLKQKSDQSRRAIIAQHRSRRFELIRLTFAQPPVDYPGFRVHREPTLHVCDSSGMAEAVRVSGSFIEMKGAWKVFSFVVDDD